MIIEQCEKKYVAIKEKQNVYLFLEGADMIFFLEILIDLNKLCFCSFIKNTCNFISSIGMGLTEEISTKIFFSEMFPVSSDVSIKKMTFIK